MKKTLLTTCNAKYIHKNLALRWLYVACEHREDVLLKEYVIKDDPLHIVQDILSMQVEVVCFSCYIWNIEIIKAVIRLLKETKPDLHILVGGPEVSYESYDLLEQGVDAISIGEGEKSVWEYIAMLEEESPHEVEGIYTKAFPNKNYQRVALSWLETLANPYFLAMDSQQMANRYFYLETSRGCPYGCSYCLSSADRCVRMFSIDYVMEILKQIANSDVKQVKLLDRTFNADPKRALRIARYINQNCKNQIFQFEVVAETLSEELLEFFTKEADVTRFRFEIGVQSFHAKTLQSVGRIQNNECLHQVIKRMREAGCILHVDLIAGLPYEDLPTFRQSFNTLFALQASEVQLGILKLLKGTKLKKESSSYGLQAQTTAPYDVVATSWLSTKELKQLHACGDAVEKFWNSGIAKDSIQAILELGWYQNPFDLFMALGEQYQKLSHPYQPHELFSCFYPILQQSKQAIDAVLLRSYYKRFKQKPHRFTDCWITQEEKKKLLSFAFCKGIANQKELFCYGLVDVGYDHGQFGYQLILYNARQTLPRRWFMNKELTYIKELKDMKEMMIATSNAHKVEEFKAMLEPLGYHIKSLLDLNEPIDIEETGTTFQENALIKARAIYERYHIAVIADDSGLAVNAMHGEPGVYSARFMGRDTSYDVKNQYIIDQCKHVADKGCQFVCAIAYVDEDGKEQVFTGIVEGLVADHMEGAKGFGYDPIFYYPPYQTTLANVSEEKKNAVSHRGRALAQLLAYLEGDN